MSTSLLIPDKRIDLAASRILWDTPFSAASFADHWDVHGGEWTVDGALKFEAIDPAPMDSRRFSRVGFEVYQSMIRVRALSVRQIEWTPVQGGYREEF